MLKSEDRGYNIAGHIVLGGFSLLCVLPFILLIVTSFTDETTLVQNGYSMFPAKFSLSTYEYLLGNIRDIGRAYGITIFNTIAGTAASLVMTSMLAYTISRRDMPHRGLMTFLVVFTMLFNGGLVPTYLVYTQILHVKNTIFGQLVPGLLMNGFTVLLIRSYFMTSIPKELIESAKIDGAGEFKTFRKIVLPMSLPILATVGLLQALAYSNDWNNGLIYITDPKLFNLQNLLNRIMMNIQFLSSTNLGTHSSDAGKDLPSETIRMAMAAIAVLPVLCAYPFFQKYFVKGITIGAVKG
ncbi:MAG: carbohydrate ABC transporter permease [Clostridiales bacterium]|nr:carbohydrate ABC transporter permease [Clostridiales bacterium]